MGLVIGAIGVLCWILIAAGTPLTTLTDRVDVAVLDRLVALRSDSRTAVAGALHALGSNWTERMFGWAVILVLGAFRRWRHVIVFVGALGLVESLSAYMAVTMQRIRPPVEILGAWEGFSNPSRPVAWFAAIVMGVALAVCVAGRPRRIALATGAIAVSALGAARMYLGVDHPSDVAFAATIGVAVPLLAFRLFTPEAVFPVAYRRGRTAHLAIDDRRLAAIRTALQDQLGMAVREAEPFGSGRLGGVDAPADQRRRGGRPGIRLREALRGEPPAGRPVVQARDAGLPVARPYGFIEITPEREYLLVTEFVQGARESGEVDVDIGVIDDALGVVRRMWDAGIAHRDIKPANVMVRDGKVVLIDVAFGQVRPSPWREAVDLANIGCGAPEVTAPTCDEEGLDTLVLMAQSVPSATMVPCVDALPSGWFVNAVDIRNGGTRIAFGSDEAETSTLLRVELAAACSTTSAVPVPSDEGGRTASRTSPG